MGMEDEGNPPSPSHRRHHRLHRVRDGHGHDLHDDCVHDHVQEASTHHCWAPDSDHQPTSTLSNRGGSLVRPSCPSRSRSETIHGRVVRNRGHGEELDRDTYEEGDRIGLAIEVLDRIALELREHQRRSSLFTDALIASI